MYIDLFSLPKYITAVFVSNLSDVILPIDFSIIITKKIRKWKT